MEHNQRNNDNGLNMFVMQLAAEKKKGVMAACLIIVMAIMWVRVFSGKTPQTSQAALIEQKQDEGTLESNSELEMLYKELPNVKGRNDRLARDFFVVDAKRLASSEEINIVSENSGEEYIERVADKLKLEAIELGGKPKAFINNKLLSVGDKLLVMDGSKTYECEVVEIEANSVSIRCGEAEITLKLTKTVEIVD